MKAGKVKIYAPDGFLEAAVAAARECDLRVAESFSVCPTSNRDSGKTPLVDQLIGEEP